FLLGKQKKSDKTIGIKLCERSWLYFCLSYLSAVASRVGGAMRMRVVMEPAPAKAGVYFDDFKVTHTKSNLIQANEYYPFGMQTASSWTRESVTGNNFLHNGGTELNTTTSLYDLDYRNYDPILGRMNQVDPMVESYTQNQLRMRSRYSTHT